MFYLISRNLEDGVLKNSAAPRVLTHFSMCAGIGISKELLIISEAISNTGKSVLSDIQKPRRRCFKKLGWARVFYPLIDVCRISERALLRVLDTLHKPWWEEKPVSTYTAIQKKVVGVEDFTDFTSGLNSN